jgi:hypothetical protein
VRLALVGLLVGLVVYGVISASINGWSELAAWAAVVTAFYVSQQQERRRV